MEIKENKYIDINPISKGRRILVYLGDFFINFILSFVLFGVMVAPLAKLITNYETKSSLFEKYEQERIDILYDNDLIFYEDEVYKYDQNVYMKFTYDCFLSYYVLTEPVEFKISNDAFGQNESNEVVKHYYVNIKNNESLYYSLFNKYNEKVGYFEIADNTIVLKDEYRIQLVEYFNPMGEMSEVGLNLYDELASNVFFALFGTILTDITEVDLRSNNAQYSYNEYNVMAVEIKNYHTTLLSVSSIISYLLSTIVVYLIYPLINKSLRTPTMSILKVDRINIVDFNKPKKVSVFILFIYAFVFNIPFVMFLPMTLVSFAYLFQFSMLVSFSFVSLVFNLISLIVLLFDSFARTISDKLSKTVLINETDLLEIYKAKGYMK